MVLPQLHTQPKTTTTYYAATKENNNVLRVNKSCTDAETQNSSAKTKYVIKYFVFGSMPVS